MMGNTKTVTSTYNVDPDEMQQNAASHQVLHCLLLLNQSSGEQTNSDWLLFVMSNCEIVTFPLEYWVRCGA